MPGQQMGLCIFALCHTHPSLEPATINIYRRLSVCRPLSGHQADAPGRPYLRAQHRRLRGGKCPYIPAHLCVAVLFDLHWLFQLQHGHKGLSHKANGHIRLSQVGRHGTIWSSNVTKGQIRNGTIWTWRTHGDSAFSPRRRQRIVSWMDGLKGLS